MTEAYCMKCKKNILMKDEKFSITKNKMKIAKGICPKCGTRVSRILGKK